MSEDKSCCKSDKYETCCEPSAGADIEETVKKSYGQRWASEKTGRSARSGRLASLLLAHQALLSELRPQAGMKVLDIGSGSGETVLNIAERIGPTGKAVGIDFTPEAIELAREKAKKRGLENITDFHEADALELPFADNSFDAVISECVVCLIQDKQRALNEKVRVLKPGGRVIMHDVITWASMPDAIREDRKLYCSCIGGAVSLDEYVEMMKKAGLTKIKTVDFTEDTKKMMNKGIMAQALNEKDNATFEDIVDFVRNGGVGYALLIGTKSAAQ